MTLFLGDVNVIPPNKVHVDIVAQPTSGISVTYTVLNPNLTPEQTLLPETLYSW